MRRRSRSMACGIFFLSFLSAPPPPESILLRESLTKHTGCSVLSRKIESLPNVVPMPAFARLQRGKLSEGGYNKKAWPSLEFDWNLDLRNCPRFKSPLSERADGGIIQSRVSSALR